MKQLQSRKLSWAPCFCLTLMPSSASCVFAHDETAPSGPPPQLVLGYFVCENPQTLLQQVLKEASVWILTTHDLCEQGRQYFVLVGRRACYRACTPTPYLAGGMPGVRLQGFVCEAEACRPGQAQLGPQRQGGQGRHRPRHGQGPRCLDLQLLQPQELSSTDSVGDHSHTSIRARSLSTQLEKETRVMRNRLHGYQPCIPHRCI